jgi:hypothetical protein
VDKAAADVEKYRAAVESNDPDKILEAFGLDDEKLVDLYIAKHGRPEPGEPGAGDSADDVRALKAEIAAFKKELADEKVKAEERRKTDEGQAAVQQRIGEIQAVMTKPENAERFEVCNAAPDVIAHLTRGEYTNAAAAAFDVMFQVWQQTKEQISFEKALELTEAHLLKSHEALSGGLGKLKKLGGAGKPAPTTAETKSAPGKEPEPAAGGDDPLSKVRAAFKKSRPRITGALSAVHPVANPNERGRAAADRRFRDKVLALQQGAKAN